MATSGDISFNNTRNEIVNDALTLIGAYGADETVSAEDSTYACRTLNRMIKNWGAQGVHLWKKDIAYLFLQADQAEYSLKSTSYDHATLSYVQTTLSADEAIGETTISITSSSGMSAGDYVGIENTASSLQWSTINNVPDSTSIVIDDPLTTACESGAKVYAYTTKLNEPFNVYSSVRMSESSIDTPLSYFSFEEYFSLPDKESSGVPVSYSYDRQLGDGIIRVWPVPESVSYIIKLTISRKIEDFNTASNTPDFPQEWLDALVSNLAVKLAPAFGKASGANYAAIVNDAKESLITSAAFDNEQGSLYMQPNYD